MKKLLAEEERLETMHRFERDLWAGGARYIGGVDEVGRGPLAGPVVAGCVVIAKPLFLRYLNDSKVVSELRRTNLDREIRGLAVAFGIGEASVEEIDRLNIANATRLAMQRAVEACRVMPDVLLVDAMRVPGFSGPQKSLIDGDAQSAAIAASSIIAKVYRDALLATLEGDTPVYGFAQHKGYGTKAHLAALRQHGPSVHHRRSFAPVRAFVAQG
jgi:ribonuclease HII